MTDKRIRGTVRGAGEIIQLIEDQLRPINMMTDSCKIHIPDTFRSDQTEWEIKKAWKRGRAKKLKQRNEVIIPVEKAKHPEKIIHTYDDGTVLYGVTEPDCDQRAAMTHSDMIYYHNRHFDYSPQRASGVAYVTGHALCWAIIDGIFHDIESYEARVPKAGGRKFYRIEG